jgi:PST family polysaccharide transporter
MMVRMRDFLGRVGGSAASDLSDELKVHFDQDALRRRSISGGAATFAAQVIRFVFQTASQIILAHLISPKEFGLVAMVVPLIGLVQLLNDLGLSQATIQRPEISQRELSALFWLNVSGTLVLSLLIVLMAPVVSWFYGQPRLTAITASLSVAVILAGLSAQHMALLNRRMQFVPLASIDVVSTAVAAIIGIAAAALGWGYWALVAMQVGNAGAVLVLSWTLARWRPSRPRVEHGIGSMVQFGGSIMAYNVFEYFTVNLDNVLVGATYGGLALGLYDRAYKLMIQPLGHITAPFTRVAVPLLSRLQDRADSYGRFTCRCCKRCC